MAVRMRKERLRTRLFAALVALRGLLLSNVLYLVSNLWALARKNAKTHSKWKWTTALSYSGWNRWIRLTTDKLTATRTVQSLLPLGHLCSGDTCVQGTPLFRRHLCSGDTKSGPRKCWHHLCICYLCWRDTSILGKGTLFLCPGDTLALKLWQTTKIVDKFKCTLVTRTVI